MRLSLWVGLLSVILGIACGTLVPAVATCNWGCALYSGYRQVIDNNNVWTEFPSGCYRGNGWIATTTGDVYQAYEDKTAWTRGGGSAECAGNPSNANNFSGWSTDTNIVCYTGCLGW